MPLDRPTYLGTLCRSKHVAPVDLACLLPMEPPLSLRYLREDPRKDLQNRCVVCEDEHMVRTKAREKEKRAAKKAAKASAGKPPAPKMGTDAERLAQRKKDSAAIQGKTAKPAKPKARGRRKKKAPPRPEELAALAEEPAPAGLPTEHYEALDSVTNDVAASYAKKFPTMEYDDLKQEGWIHALDGYAGYQRKCAEEEDFLFSVKGLRGWVYRVIRVRLAMFTRKGTCPVSFPKKAVPDRIREGIRSVSADLLPITDQRDLFSELADRDLSRIVDRAMGKTLTTYPLARMVIRDSLPASDVAAQLGANDILKEVRRQACAARKDLKARLEKVLHDAPVPRKTHDCRPRNAPSDQCTPRGSDRCAT